jgi:hypothetical protein
MMVIQKPGKYGRGFQVILVEQAKRRAVALPDLDFRPSHCCLAERAWRGSGGPAGVSPWLKRADSPASVRLALWDFKLARRQAQQ